MLRRRTFFTGERGGLPPEIVWHGIEPGQARLFLQQSFAGMGPGRSALRPASTNRSRHLRRDECVLGTAWHSEIPAAPSGRAWRRAVDTALRSPDDIIEEDKGPHVPVLQVYRVQPHSMIILVSELNDKLPDKDSNLEPSG